MKKSIVLFPLPSLIKKSFVRSFEHWSRFKGDFGETSERRGGAHMGFAEHIDTILN